MSQPFALSACLLAISGTLATCEDDQAAARRDAAMKIEAAADQFERVARIKAMPGGEAFAERRTELEGVLRDARGVPDASGGPRGSKNLLLASVQRELAAMDLAEASVGEDQLRLERRLVHSLLDAGQTLSSLVEGRRSIDLSDARTRIENQRQTAGELERESAEAIAELEAPILEMTAANLADEEEVSRLLDEANRLRREAGELGPSLGFSRFEQAVNLEREADRHQYAIARREIDLDYELRPDHRIAQLRAEEAARMLESVGRSERSLEEFLQAMQQDAGVTEEQVRQLGAEIAGRIDQLDTAVAGSAESVSALYDSAVGRLEEAAQKATAAARDMSGNDAAAARLAEARAHAQLGRAYRAMTAGLSEHRTLTARLGMTGDVVGDTTRYQQRLQELTARLEEVRGKITEAYTSAQSSLGQVNFRGRDVGDANLALGAFKSAVDEALATMTGEPGQLPLSLEGGAAAPTAGGTPAAPAGDVQVSGRGLLSPEALLQRLQGLGDSGSDFDTFVSLCVGSPDTLAMLGASKSMMTSMEQLQDAYEAQYGQRMSGMAGQAMASGAAVPNLGNASIESQTDDTAVCRYEGPMGPDQLTFRKVDGRWYINADELMDTGGAVSAAQIQQMGQALQDVVDDLAPRIRRGEFPSAQAAEQAIAQGLMQAMMGAMGGAPGGGN